MARANKTLTFTESRKKEALYSVKAQTRAMGKPRNQMDLHIFFCADGSETVCKGDLMCSESLVSLGERKEGHIS